MSGANLRINNLYTQYIRINNIYIYYIYVYVIIYMYTTLKLLLKVIRSLKLLFKRFHVMEPLFHLSRDSQVFLFVYFVLTRSLLSRNLHRKFKCQKTQDLCGVGRYRLLIQNVSREWDSGNLYMCHCQ